MQSRIIFTSLITLMMAFAPAEQSRAAQADLDNLLASYPGLRTYNEGNLITRIYGVPFGTGSSPTETADTFLSNYSEVYGVPIADLDTIGSNYDGTHVIGVMYDAQTSSYKYSLVSYAQYLDGDRVFGSDIYLLIRNNANLNYPLVLAASTLRDTEDFSVSAALKSIDMDQVVASFTDPDFPELTNKSEPLRVVWAGEDDSVETARCGIEFTGDDGADPVNEAYSYVIDIITSEIIYKASSIYDADVNGTVSGYTTFGHKPAECSNDVLTPLPYKEISVVGGETVYSDINGNYQIPNEGTDDVTVLSPMRGRWFFLNVHNGTEDAMSISATPLEPIDFVHNSSQTPLDRAQSNAYLFANTARDFALKFNPNYPGLQVPVKLRVNQPNCNPRFFPDGMIIQPYMTIQLPWNLGECLQTAERTIFYHEYGHLLVFTGSGLGALGRGKPQQGFYGEALGDAFSVVLTDQPGLGFGHKTFDCDDPLRDADNNTQYPCVNNPHACAPLLAGCIWDTRNSLAITNPTSYTDILVDLLTNSILLHGTNKVAPSIAIDFLTLDDDDGIFDNRGPHAIEIYDGFSVHNMMPEDPGKIWVDAAIGDDLTADGSLYYPFATISAGILNAASGDTVLVRPGTYQENNIDFLGKAITVKGVGSPWATTITTNVQATLVIFRNDEDSNSVLDGFRLLGGGRGVICYNAGPTIIRCLFKDQAPSFNEGALNLWGATYNSVGSSPAKIINCTFMGSSRSAIVDRSYDPPVIKNTIIYDNDDYGINWNTQLNKPWEAPELSYNCVNSNGTDYGGGITDSGIGSLHINPNLAAGGGLWILSTVIDLGDPDPIYNDPDGSRNDMGSWPYQEIQEPPPPPPRKPELEEGELPKEFALNQNYPNPFNPVTVISFSLPVASEYELTIYNILGQEVKTFKGHSEPGTVDIYWDASTYGSGIYLYRLTAGTYTATKKMIVLK